jgi:hypothetical protein
VERYYVTGGSDRWTFSVTGERNPPSISAEKSRFRVKEINLMKN